MFATRPKMFTRRAAALAAIAALPRLALARRVPPTGDGRGVALVLDAGDRAALLRVIVAELAVIESGWNDPLPGEDDYARRLRRLRDRLTGD